MSCGGSCACRVIRFSGESVATIVAFGSVGFLGIIGSFVLDAKKARQYVDGWRAFAAATSNVPFLAILHGR
jgi:uncharacterized membrane protein